MLTRAAIVALLSASLAVFGLPSARAGAQRTPREQLAHARRLLDIPVRRIEADRAFRQAFDAALRLHDTTTLVEAAGELGEVRRRRWLTGRDRRLYTSNIVFDPIAAERRMHYTREFLEQHSRPVADVGAIDRLEAERWFRRARDARPGDAAPLLPLLDLLTEERRFDEMRALTLATIALADSSARLRMTAGLAAVRLNRIDEADAHFARAAILFDETTRAELQEIGRLLRVGDSTRVAGLGDAASRGTLAAFWEAADPLLDTPANEARLEYLARMAYADLHFRDTPSAPPGWRTDRGTVLVRYGIPPVIATFSPMSDADARDAIGRVITVWYYPEREVDFVFTGPPAFNVANFAGNFRDVAQARRDAAPFLLDDVTAARGVDSLMTQVARFRGARDGELEVVVGTTLPVSTFYAGMGIDQSDLLVSVRAGAAGSLRVAARDTIAVVLPTTAALTRHWAIQLSEDSISRARSLGGASPVRIRIEARDPALTQASARTQSEVAPLPATNAFTISDVLLVERPTPAASAAGMATQRWAARGVRPRGSEHLLPGDTIGLYWEVYHPTADRDGRTRYDVEIRVTLLELDRGRDPVRRTLGSLADLVGLSAEGEQQLALRFRRDEARPTLPSERLSDLVTIGLGSAPAGTYRLDLLLTDAGSGQRTQTSRTLRVIAPQ